jgi:linearmycin/streptolysin S transport system permease protein
MHHACTIAAKDLRRRLRDRTALLVAIVLPLGLAWIFSLTLGDIETAGFQATYTVVDLDHGGQLPADFRGVLQSLNFVTLRDAETASAAETLAKDGDIDAAFVFPAGFTEQVQAGLGGEIRVLGSPDSSVASLVAVSLARSYGSNLNAIGLSVATVAGTDDGAVDPALVARAQTVPAAARLRTSPAKDEVTSQSTFFAIGMAVFFLFFAVEFGVRGLLEEREGGTLSRLLVAPVSPASVIGGKALASFALGLTSTVVLVFASTWLLGAEWGDVAGVAALVLGGVLSAVGVTALVATLAKTTAQAGAYVSIVAIVGGLLGGTFFPISQAGLLGTIRFLSPQGWLMQGFTDLAGGASLARIAAPLAGVLAIATATGAIAWARARRMVAG